MTNKIPAKPYVRFLLTATIFIVTLLTINPEVFAKAENPVFTSVKLTVVKTFVRTELYFGMNKTDGTKVSEEEWQKFLAEEVTSRFPQGFTVVEGNGQYRDINGEIIKEKSKILILLYPAKMQKSASRKIEQIRRAYKKQFLQESVMRLDFVRTMRVSF